MRAGFTLLETLLFFGIVGIISVTFVSVYIATQEARVRQQAIAEVEQRGALLLSTMTKTIRRAEAVLLPAANQTGSILALQMRGNGEFPTIFTRNGSGMAIVQKTTTGSLLNTRSRVGSFTAQNVEGTAVFFSFVLTTTVPSIPPSPYSRRFEATVSLFPDHELEAGGCGSCSVPTCANGVLQWHHCQSDVCTVSTTTLPC